MDTADDNTNGSQRKLREVNWARWQPRNSLRLEECVALSLGYDPDDLDIVRRLSAFVDRIEVSVWVARDPDDRGRLGFPAQLPTPPNQETSLPVSDFVRFAKSNGWSMPVQLEEMGGRVSGQLLPHSSWPWGGYETKALRVLAAAVREHWVRYDKTDASTAPTDDEVIGWLMKNHGIGPGDAKAIARLIRADGLPKGRRRR